MWLNAPLQFIFAQPTTKFVFKKFFWAQENEMASIVATVYRKFQNLNPQNLFAGVVPHHTQYGAHLD